MMAAVRATDGAREASGLLARWMTCLAKALGGVAAAEPPSLKLAMAVASWRDWSFSDSAAAALCSTSAAFCCVI